MDAILNIPELVREFVTRTDYIAFYLGFVGFWCLWLAFRGLKLGDTKAFGFRAPDAVGVTAVEYGRVWLVMGIAMVSTGSVLWFSVA